MLLRPWCERIFGVESLCSGVEERMVIARVTASVED